MIKPILRFGRSASIYNLHIQTIVVLSVLFCILSSGLMMDVSAIGASGLYTTQFKMEYQYSDYNDYKYPAIEPGDSVKYEYLDPYIVNFPENRALVKLIQLFGPMTTFEVRYEYSDLSEGKNQDRVFFRLDKEITNLTTLYGSYQYLNINYDSPDSNASTGHMASIGLKHDRSGWFKGEVSFSYDHNRSPVDLLTQTYMPMAQLRWSIDSYTALSGRWDGYWAVSDSGTYPAHAFTIFISRYFPTETAVHLFMRFYNSEDNVHSIAPAIEIAQYIRWNLTARLTYRFYQNQFDTENAPDFVEGNSVTSNSIRAYLEWELLPAIKMHLKLRRYTSDQDIRMNTYLIGFEYEL